MLVIQIRLVWSPGRSICLTRLVWNKRVSKLDKMHRWIYQRNHRDAAPRHWRERCICSIAILLIVEIISSLLLYRCLLRCFLKCLLQYCWLLLQYCYTDDCWDVCFSIVILMISEMFYSILLYWLLRCVLQYYYTDDCWDSSNVVTPMINDCW